MNIIRIFFALLGLVVFNAWADSAPVGTVKTVSGDAFIVTGSSQARATLGLPVYMGSQLKTGAKSSLGVVFNDASVMSFGSNTDLTIDDYLYQPESAKPQLAVRLAKGSMNYLSGAIAKLHPQAVVFKGPSGTLGVRGTHLLMLADGGRSFVILLADPDGSVGKLLIQGARGEQLIDTANFGALLDGSQPQATVDASAIQNVFGEALGARPVQPPLPTRAQGIGSESGPAGTSGAGAQLSQQAAVGGISRPTLLMGAAVLGAVLQSMLTTTATSGTTGTQ